MTVVPEWTELVYNELTDGGGPLTSDEAERAIDAIKKHCPFKPEVTYVEFPVKLEGTGPLVEIANKLAEWINSAPLKPEELHDVYSAHVLLADLVQKASKEPPLLQCSHCGNTESCAGAMARFWNHGRCKFCAGYFKVVRA